MARSNEYDTSDSSLKTLVDDLLHTAIGHENDEEFLRNYFAETIEAWRCRFNLSDRDPR